MKNKIRNVMILFIIIAILLGVHSASKLVGGEWTCIAKTCNEWAYGDDWITDNCRPEGEENNKTLMCTVSLEGELIKVPLDNINVSLVKSCREFVCVTEVYVKGGVINEK